MTRTVIRLQKSGDAVWLNLDRAPIEFEQDSFPIDLASITGDTLTDRGRSLAALLTQREPVKGVLTAAFASDTNAAPAPIYFHVVADAADAVAWEQIFTDSRGFCVLDARWPMGRIASIYKPVPVRGFRPPFNVVAVLSAAGKDGARQLDALLAAVAGVGPGIKLHVITGDEAIRDRAQAGGASAELIAATAPALCTQIADARPHLIHLLCHGQLTAGVRTLRFAQISDFDNDIKDFGSINVPVSLLAKSLNGCDPWLVVLAACQSAAAGAEGGPAYAHALVNEGVAAVIGMRRLVDLNDTNRFCAALYPDVLAIVKRAVAPVARGESVRERIIDWAEALTNPRQVMSNPDPSVVDTWLDPVLYVQGDDLRLYPQTDEQPVAPPEDAAPEDAAPEDAAPEDAAPEDMAPDEQPAQLSAEEYAELQGKLDQFRGIVAAADPATTDPATIAAVQSLIAGVEAQLGRVGA